jgi:hypothetical protein
MNRFTLSPILKQYIITVAEMAPAVGKIVQLWTWPCQLHLSFFLILRQPYNACRDGDFILVDTEQFDNGRVIATIAEHTQAKGTIAMNPSLRLSTSSAAIVRKALKQQQKSTVLKQVVAWKDELSLMDSSGIVEFAALDTYDRKPSLMSDTIPVVTGARCLA